MTPQQLETWPTRQLQDALGAYQADYDPTQQSLITTELERRGAATTGVRPREGIAGFVDEAAATGGHPHRTYFFAALICAVFVGIGGFGLWRLAQGHAVDAELIVCGVGGLVLGVKLLLNGIEVRQQRR